MTRSPQVWGRKIKITIPPPNKYHGCVRRLAGRLSLATAAAATVTAATATVTAVTAATAALALATAALALAALALAAAALALAAAALALAAAALATASTHAATVSASTFAIVPTSTFATVPTSTSAISIAYVRVNCGLIRRRADRDDHLHPVRGHRRLRHRQARCHEGRLRERGGCRHEQHGTLPIHATPRLNRTLTCFMRLLG